MKGTLLLLLFVCRSFWGLAQSDSLSLAGQIPSDAQSSKLLLTNTLSVFPGTSFQPWLHSSALFFAGNEKGVIGLGINSFAREGEVFYQGEWQAYPKLADKAYADLCLNAAPKAPYPFIRLAADYYQGLSSLELCAGLRFATYQSFNIQTAVLGLGVYPGSHYISTKSFVSYGDGKAYLSQLFQWRYYTSKENFFSLRLYSGKLPDDPRQYTLNVRNELGILSAYYGLRTVGGNIGMSRWGERFGLLVNLGYDYEEYYPELFRNKLYFTLSLGKKF